MHTAELISQAISLPVEERALIVDCLLRSLNAPQPEIDQQWVPLARKRLAELRSGKVQPVSAEEVFSKIRRRFTTAIKLSDSGYNGAAGRGPLPELVEAVP